MDITKFYAIPGEGPLDNPKPHGGFFGIFRTVACVGDSLSSGEMESLDESGNRGYHDYFEYSWGQYMARAAGSTAYNFSRGGMTAKEYLDSFAEAKGFWNPALAAQAYIFALGVNDLYGRKQALGTADDVDMDTVDGPIPDTFAGYYGRVLAKYRAIEPKSRLFLMTMPQRETDDPLKTAHADLLHDIAAKIPFCYVIDLTRHAPRHDAEFRRHFYLGGHLNAAGYQLTALQTMTYIDWIIRQHPEDFTQVAFIGKGGVHNTEYKW
ncbi:MAG: SGNH/GDSL hydrolase family protein [Clostridia bacterium]|nr:SGNH/GDSL hydrolase family protein [Clostridia bacterium]